MGAADNFFNKAELAVKKRNYDYAIELWQQGLMIDPDRADERRKMRGAAIRRCQENGGDTTGGKMFKVKNMGRLGKIKKLGLQKKWDEQIVELERVLSQAPQYTAGLMDLGHAFLNTERKASAIQTFTEVVELDRSQAEAWKALGRLYGEKEDVERAVQCWETVRQIRPDDAEAGKAIRDLSAAAMMKKADARRTEGEGSFRDLLKDADESEKLQKKAQMIRTEDDAKTAVDLKRNEIERDKENPRLWRELGDLHLKMNEFDEAQSAYETARELKPDDMYAKDKLGNLEERKIQHELELARAAVKKAPDDAAAKERLEAAEQALNDFLLVELERRVASHPTDYGLKYKFGELLLKNGELDRAIAQFQLARKDPKFLTGSHHRIGRCFFRKKRYELAIKEFNAALEHITESDSEISKEVRYDLAEAFLAKGDKAQSLNYFEEIMSVDIGYRDVSQRVDEISEAP